MDWISSLAQVFGGCCYNVYLLETLLNENRKAPHSTDVGWVVTFCQFVLVTVVSAYPNVDFSSETRSWRRLYLKSPAIPLLKLLFLVILFFLVSTLTNSVWRFGLSMPIQIIFRSSGTVFTMIVGYLYGGKRYNTGQIMSSLLMSIGTILVVLQGSNNTSSLASVEVNWQFCYGVFVLIVTAVLSAFMGLYNERLYAQYGPLWQETLFYSHFLGLPLFLFFGRTLFSDIQAIWHSQPKYTFHQILILKQAVFLLLNAGSQVICARGVNQLAGISSSLTLTVVLLVRKFVSLAISSYLFGAVPSSQALIGSTLLVIGTIQYSVATVLAKKRSWTEKASGKDKQS